MPRVKKLTAAEVAELTKRVSRVELGEYVDLIKGFKSGDWGRVELDAAETQRVVKRRLTLAAKQQGLRIRYRPTRDQEDKIWFRVL